MPATPLIAEGSSWIALSGPTSYLVGSKARKFWLCKCACGRTAEVREEQLRAGTSKQCMSCRSMAIRKRPARTLHIPNELYHRLSMKARAAIGRCVDPQHVQYDDYGRRGIQVYAEWVRDPCAFILYLHSLPGCEDETLVLDREDNDGHYEPGNLRFVTHYVSTHNTRRG